MSPRSLPLTLGFILHGLRIQLGALRGFATPIKREWFGENETYRGWSVPLGTAVGFVVIDPPVPITATCLVGVSLGLPLFLYQRQRHLDRAAA